ncbi:MAG: tRNA 5-methoxyuridine(34)/uridine 5-oxyacetic acid(34) synthase CmoB [Gammaproteobacteria bacterium]|nr:tRNA 5-methoxyuridine(34)/uridine 5-oxyacetic acid(34) synthase CmoB [Gammaproteobacteria bacterium]
MIDKLIDAIALDRLGKISDNDSINAWLKTAPKQIESRLAERPHGELEGWLAEVDQLPTIPATKIDLNQATVSVHGKTPVPSPELEALKTRLMTLHPWRKGPFNIHGLKIDTEWRSNWKWQRIAPHISPLKGRAILDVGCGNGYYGWRMIGAGAKLVIGIDPTLKFVAQFWAIRHFLGDHWPHILLPLGIESLPGNLEAFDSVFSMGVLYHRRSPIDHLLELKAALRPGGELILETLVIDQPLGNVLLPEGRYAKMRNVWFIPSPDDLALWLKRVGFKNIKRVDMTPTGVEEQRPTEWMTFESLPDFIDPDDHSKTIEGYPAPLRATFVATRA